MKGQNMHPEENFEDWQRRKDERKRHAIKCGRLTPYDLAVNELAKAMSVSTMGGRVFGGTIASMLGRHRGTINSELRGKLEEDLEKEVGRARSGDKGAMSFCAEAIRTFSRHEQQVPQNLAQLAFDVMTGCVLLKQSRGRPKQEARDFWIRIAISNVAEAFPDMHITRNEATASESICAVFARASQNPRCESSKEKGGLSEKAVERIWAGRKTGSPF